jgi:monoamine oxidase
MVSAVFIPPFTVIPYRDRPGRLTVRTEPCTAAPPGALDLGATWFWDGERRVADLAARLGVDTFEQHLAGDTLVRDATGVRRLPGNLIDAPARRFAPGADALARSLAAELPADVLRLDTPVTAIRRGTTGGLEVHTPAR